MAGLNPRLEPASVRGYAGAPRAPDTSLNCAKAQALLSFRLPGLQMKSEVQNPNLAEPEPNATL